MYVNIENSLKSLCNGFIIRDEYEETCFTSRNQNALDELKEASITYRIALGKNKGKKLLTLRTLSSYEKARKSYLVQSSGFSLHAGITCRGDERDKLERICRYIARPSLSEERLSLNQKGQIIYKLKTPYQNGTTHILFEPLDFLSRLSSLIPKPKINLIRFFGVFAPHSKHRNLVTKQKKTSQEKISSSSRSRMTWAQRLKRVFKMDISSCSKCQGKVRIIASVEESSAIEKILSHLGFDPIPPQPWAPRAPP